MSTNNLDRLEKILETHTSSELTQEEIETLNKPIPSKEFESVTKNLPTTTKKQNRMASLVNSDKLLKNNEH